MPICFDPDSEIKVILKTDQGKPNPPTAVCRPLTGRLMIQVIEFLDEVKTSPDQGIQISALFSALQIVLIRWDHFPELKIGQEPIDYLTPAEADEIVGACFSAGSLDAEDKKK